MQQTIELMLDDKMTNVDKTTTTWNLEKALIRQLSQEILQIILKKVIMGHQVCLIVKYLQF